MYNDTRCLDLNYTTHFKIGKIKASKLSFTIRKKKYKYLKEETYETI